MARGDPCPSPASQNPFNPLPPRSALPTSMRGLPAVADSDMTLIICGMSVALHLAVADDSTFNGGCADRDPPVSTGRQDTSTIFTKFIATSRLFRALYRRSSQGGSAGDAMVRCLGQFRLVRHQRAGVRDTAGRDSSACSPTGLVRQSRA